MASANSRNRHQDGRVQLKDRTYTCTICGRTYVPVQHNQTCCTDECATENNRRRNRKRNAEAAKHKHAERTCVICGTMFLPRNRNNLCCSPDCSDIRKARLSRQRRGERKIELSEDHRPTPGTLDLEHFDTEEVISEMHRRGFFVTKEPLTSGERFKVNLSPFDGDKVKFAVISDTHLCSRQQQLSHLTTFYRMCSDRGITEIFHAGDLVEGDGKQHKGQIYDLFVHGIDEQVAYVCEYYPHENGVTTHFIQGSHDYSFFKSSGYDIGKAIAERREDMNYLGVFDAYVDIAPNVDMNIHHPGGGTAYALSYNSQKKIESYTPENKPRLAVYGHYHRVLWMPAYRNVDAFLAPCFQAQTPFLSERKIYPVIGGWIIEATVNEDGLANVQPECLRFYIPVNDDF